MHCKENGAIQIQFLIHCRVTHCLLVMSGGGGPSGPSRMPNMVLSDGTRCHYSSDVSIFRRLRDTRLAMTSGMRTARSSWAAWARRAPG